MELKQKIEADAKAAMKERAAEKVSTLRMLIAALKNKEIDKRRPLAGDEVIETVRSLIKQRKDSVEQFAKGGRQDLVDKETAEIAVLEAYLPKQLTPAELEDMVRQAVAETGAQGVKDMGKVMKAVAAKAAGRADNKLVSELVKQALG